GGQGANDRLTFDDTDAFGPSRFTLWEQVDLTNASSLTLGGGALTLGDSGTGTGQLSIDSSSTLLSGSGQSSGVPFNSGALVTVANAGTIDLSTNAPQDTDSLRIAGNYAGSGGRILFNTFLRSDGSPSDLLIMDRGNASGSTTLSFTDTGGLGAETTGNGILVVNTTNGGTTEAGAFSGFAVAGPYQYDLFRGSKD